METKTLADLIAIKSFDLKENKEIIDYLEGRFAPYASQIVRVKNSDSEKENLVVGINCKLENIDAIILSGHIDTVVADEKKYLTNPYEATENDSKIYGLGAIDMKCFFSSIIDNIEALRQIKTPIVVCVSSDEETKQDGVREMIKFLKEKNIKPVCTIVGEPTNLAVCTSSRSCNIGKVKITGKSCHSSNPKNGVNAIYVASRLNLFIESLSDKYAGTTLSVGVISGGEKFNIVAGEAYLEFDLRSSSLKDIEKIDNLIKKEIVELEKLYQGINIDYICEDAAPPLERTHVEYINSLIKELGLKEGAFVAAAEAGRFQIFNAPTFIFGAGDLSLAHKPNEFLDLKRYEEYNKLLILMLEKISCNLQVN